RIAPGERGLVALRREPVEQEVRDDGVTRLAVRSRPQAPEAPRVDARRRRFLHAVWIRAHSGLLHASVSRKSRSTGRARSTMSWPSSGETDRWYQASGFGAGPATFVPSPA